MTEDEKKKTANLEDVQAFGRIIHNKGIGSEGTCSTAAATAAKAVTVGTTFKPVAGATLIVTFQNAITVANATLAVTYGASGSQQTLAAKPIYYRGSALAANLVEAGATLVLRYDGTNYNIIGSLQIDPFPSQSGNNGKFLKTNGSAVSWDNIPSDITKADKVSGATNGNFAGLDENGNIKDSGKKESDFQAAITDLAQIGNGIGTCSTAADTAAKVVTLSGYELKSNGFVAVTFDNDVPANATLNINGKGAKTVYYNGAAITAGVIRGGDTVQFCYDGTNYVLLGILSVPCETVRITCTAEDNVAVTGKKITVNGTEYTLDYSGIVQIQIPYGERYTISAESWIDYLTPASQTFTAGILLRDVSVVWETPYVDLGLPSGVLWAKCNIGATRPEDSGLYFSWGNIIGYGAKHDFQTEYPNTPGGALTASFSPGDATYDAARANMGYPWRMPSTDDFTELLNNTTHVQTSINGVTGFLFTSTVAGYTDKTLFIPRAGRVTTGGLVDDLLQCWTYQQIISTHAYALFGGGGYALNPADSNVKFIGVSVRAVR